MWSVEDVLSRRSSAVTGVEVIGRGSISVAWTTDETSAMMKLHLIRGPVREGEGHSKSLWTNRNPSVLAESEHQWIV